MDIKSVVEAKEAINSLKSVLPIEVFNHVSNSVDRAIFELLEVKQGITEPMPEDEHGAANFSSLDAAIKRYVEERDALREASAAFKLVEDGAKDRMHKISMWLRDKGDQLGVDSFKTMYGTAYRNVKTSFRVGSWDDFIGWVKETENFQCLEKRVAKLATKEIYDASGVVPPGIDYVAEVSFDVRRPTKTRGDSDE